MSEITNSDVIEYISNMKVIELSELVKDLEEKFGVSASAPVAMMGPVGAGGQEAQKEEEQTEFTLNLVGFGEKKIQESHKSFPGPSLVSLYSAIPFRVK